jgi:hypothetical protein
MANLKLMKPSAEEREQTVQQRSLALSRRARTFGLSVVRQVAPAIPARRLACFDGLDRSRRTSATCARRGVSLAIVVTFAFATPAFAALPAVPEFPGPPTEGKEPLVRPHRIVWGAGTFAGRGRPSHRPPTGQLRWRRWTPTSASATGADWMTDCGGRPNCAHGLRTPYPVKLTLSRPRVLGPYFVFTQIRITFLVDRSAGVTKRSVSGIWLDYSRRSGYFWWIPID